jgi:hypothetical protein
MMESPDVAIIQHASDVMQVVHNLFDNASKSYFAAKSLFETNVSSHLSH